MFGVLALGDGAAVTGISTRKSSHIQTNSWESLEEGVQGTESGGTFWHRLHGVLRELPLQTFRKQQQDMQSPGF